MLARSGRLLPTSLFHHGRIPEPALLHVEFSPSSLSISIPLQYPLCLASHVAGKCPPLSSHPGLSCAMLLQKLGLKVPLH